MHLPRRLLNADACELRHLLTLRTQITPAPLSFGAADAEQRGRRATEPEEYRDWLLADPSDGINGLSAKELQDRECG